MLGKQVEEVLFIIIIIIRDMQSPHLVCAFRDRRHFSLNIYIKKNKTKKANLCAYTPTCVFMRLYVPAWHTAVLSAWLDIFTARFPLLSVPLLPSSPTAFCSAGTYMHVCRISSVHCCCGTRQLHCNAALCALIGGETSAMWCAGWMGRRKRQYKDTGVVISDG